MPNRRAIAKTMPREVIACEADDPSLLEPGHSFRRLAEIAGLARLHLDEHERPTIPRHDVQFAAAYTVAAGKNCVPATRQFLAGEILASFAKGHPPGRHTRVRQQPSRQSHVLGLFVSLRSS